MMRTCHYCNKKLDYMEPGQPPSCPDTGRDVCADCYTSDEHEAAIARQRHGAIPSGGSGKVGKLNTDADW